MTLLFERAIQEFDPTDAAPDDDRYRSLFEHLFTDEGVYGPAIGNQLTTQYRMHVAIAAFPNRAFYDGSLRNGVDVDPVGDLPPLVGVDVTGDERTDETGSHFNPSEARVTRGLVERLLEADLDGGDVAVITPYRAQVHAVASELGDLAADDVAVDTVDSFQGGERAAVVIPFVRSNDRGDIGFLGRAGDGPRRLNVALTRAERFCGLVGDWDTLRDDGDHNECADLYRDLHDHVTDAGAWWDAGGDWLRREVDAGGPRGDTQDGTRLQTLSAAVSTGQAAGDVMERSVESQERERRTGRKPSASPPPSSSAGR